MAKHSYFYYNGMEKSKACVLWAGLLNDVLIRKKTAQSSRLKKVACKWWWKWALGTFRDYCKKNAIAHLYPLRYKLRKRIPIWHGVLELQCWLDDLILFVSRWATQLWQDCRWFFKNSIFFWLELFRFWLHEKKCICILNKKKI